LKTFFLKKNQQLQKELYNSNREFEYLETRSLNEINTLKENLNETNASLNKEILKNKDHNSHV
jgi:hypothetical protein